jgi:hypothetical protein
MFYIMSEREQCKPQPHSEADFPWAVDIPIPPAGNGRLLPILMDSAKACPGGALFLTYADPPAGEVQTWFNRIATRSPEDARRLACTFRSIGARRVR